MSDLIWLSKVQMQRVEPHFPLSHGVPRVDDRLVISGIIFVIRNGLRWRDAPAKCEPHKTIYNRFIHWSCLDVFNRIFAALATTAEKPDQSMIDPTRSLMYRGHQGRLELKASRYLRLPARPLGHATPRKPDERLQGRSADD